MAGTVCYLKLNRNVEVMEDSVFLKDVGSVYCADKPVCYQCAEDYRND